MGRSMPIGKLSKKQSPLASMFRASQSQSFIIQTIQTLCVCPAHSTTASGCTAESQKRIHPAHAVGVAAPGVHLPSCITVHSPLIPQ